MSGRKAKEARRAEMEKTGKNPKELKKAKKTASQDIFLIALVCCIAIALVAVLVVNIVNGNKGPGTFAYSEGIAEDGFWEDTTALDYVELFDYQSFSIPSEIHAVPDAEVKSEIESIVADHNPVMKQVTDRAIVDGDNVNIDYIGRVDGVPFDNGSTEGAGTDVTAGSANYIDDFLTQIIGHRPGETFDVEVTFPEDYGAEELNGKDAVFETTINYISEYDITDSYVAENLTEEHGWTTVREMEAGVREDMQKTRVENYIRDYMGTEVALSSTPDEVAAYRDKLITFQEKSMLEYYEQQAASNEMELDDFLQIYAGVSDKDEMLEQNRTSITAEITRSMVVQAIAEDAEITVSDEDKDNYLPDYASYEDQFGKPWLTQYVLGLKVLNYIYENAVLA